MKNQAEIYITGIVEDLRERFVRDETVVSTNEKIERIYEFEDGAIVKYEWQDFSVADSSKDNYNHRFTLEKVPSPNPDKLKTGTIRTIEYSGSR